MKKHSLIIALSACAVLNMANPAHAYEAGDIILRAGVIQVSPATDDGTGLGLDVANNVQLGIAGSYLITPHMGVELLGATPFKHDITLGGNKIGSTQHLPPTVSLQWYPLSAEKVQPYVGIGVNHTMFFNIKNSIGVDLNLSDSTGLAIEAGVDYAITPTLTLNASVWKIDINTDVSINGADNGTLEIDPVAAMIGATYKF